MLRAAGLRKEYASVVAVDGVSFEARRGEILGLLGPNGAGKTTSIRLVLNILGADAGTILYDGRPFSEEVRNAVGYLPEERGLYRKSRVLDTILYFARLRGMSAGTAKADSYRWLQRFGLLEAKDRRVEELSKGNQQKVQFITALLHDPALLVLDEPFSGLDPINQIMFKEVLLEMKEAGKAIVFSTHQMDAAERLSDTICLIDRGKVVVSGALSAVKRRYGTDVLHLECEGDTGFLPSLPGVRSVLRDGNLLELSLDPSTPARGVLGAILQRVDVRRFEVKEPSLQSIFLGLVGGTLRSRNDAGGGAT